MGRFNIRPRYGANEPTGGERIGSSISEALDQYDREREARRTDENTLRAQGGVAVGTPPSVGDRFGAVKHSIARVFGRGGPTTAFTDETQPSPTPVVGQQGDVRGDVRGQAPPPVSSSLRGSPSFVDQSQAPRPPMGRAGGTPPIMPQRPASIGAAIGSAIGQPDDLSYEQTARGGQRYRFDPMRGKKAEIALADTHKAKDEQEEIDALVSTGQWTPQQAAARVRGKLAYGEEFGRTRQANQLTFQQRQELVDRTNKGRVAVARIMSEGRQNTAEARQVMQQQLLDLREAALALQAAGLDATGYENAAKALEAQIPKGTDALVAGSQPGGKQAIAATTRAAGAARDSAVAIRNRGKQAADRVLGGAPRAPLPKLTQEQYDAGRAKGHSDADIAKSYDVTGLTRRP